MKKFFLYLFFFQFFFSNVNANSNIVFVDIDFLLENSTIGKNAIIKLEQIDKQNVTSLKKKEANLKKIENEIKKKQNIISEEEFKNEVDSLKQKISQLKQEKDLMVKDFTKIKNEEIGKVIIKINETIQEYMNKNSVDLVFDKKKIYIGKNLLNITGKILDQLENK